MYKVPVSDPVARLIERRQGRPPRVHELDPGVYMLGRAFAADVTLDHVDVSRHHAELEVTFDGATIRDLDSKNGVTVDGQRTVGWTPVDDGSRIALGKLELALDHPGARVGRVLLAGGEPTVRRVRPSPEPGTRASRSRVGILAPALAAVAFGVLLILLLVFG